MIQEVITWTPARARVLSAVYLSQLARTCSRFGQGERPFPRTRPESAELLALHAAALVQTRGKLRSAQGWRRLSVEEWGETYWRRRGGPMRADAGACRVFFSEFACRAWERP
jgi:hypothetical protein